VHGAGLARGPSDQPVAAGEPPVRARDETRDCGFDRVLRDQRTLSSVSKWLPSPTDRL
jgi:hypothetical protein